MWPDKLSFCPKICLLHASPGAMAEDNRARLKPFMLARSVSQRCSFSHMLYILAVEPFPRDLQVNLVLHGITSSGTTNLTRYSAYADIASTLVMNNARMSVKKSSCMNVAGAKINHKSVGLQLDL